MDVLLVGLITAGAIVLFVRERFPADVVAILVLGSLAVLGLVTPTEAISGFSNAAVITVAGMFVMSAGLRETGALHPLARLLGAIGITGPVLLIVMVLVVAAISGFINNTAAVAVFLPVVLAVARRRNVAPSKLLIPLSYASQFGGVCTLVGTSTNLVVNSLAVGAGLASFGMFDFGKLGLILVATGTVYLLTVGWWLLPSRSSPPSLEDAYALREYVCSLRVPPDAKVVGRTIQQSAIETRGGTRIVEIVRGEARLIGRPEHVIQAGDTLMLEGTADALFESARRAGLSISPPAAEGELELEGGGLQLVELVIPPMSRLVGRAVGEISRYARAVPLAIARRGAVVHGSIEENRVGAGDLLLLLVDDKDLPSLQSETDVIVLSARESPMVRGRKALLAVAIVAAVVAAAAAELLPIEIGALLGGAAMIVSGCLPVDRAYRQVELRVLVLIAAMLPLGIAIENTGAAQALVRGMTALIPAGQPVVALAVVYFMTMVLTEFISNNATAVLMTPIAIALATQLGLQPAPFLVAVAFAASTSFSTPIGYQTNTMVYNAGGYQFADFARVGIPLNILFFVVSVIAIPRLFPF